MKRKRIDPICSLIATTWLVVMTGCATLQESDAIIHVTASGDAEKAMLLTNAGINAVKVGAMERAAHKFSQAIAADETYGPAHNNLGLLHYERGDLYDAVLSFEQAMDYLPDDPTVYYNLALALESAGKTHEAMDLYQQAVEIDPTNPNFLGNLVRLRVRLGENDPSLVAQLQDLVLIETRSSWRRWADGQLALHFNDALDRGPATPDFNTETDRERGDSEKVKKVIDLTPPKNDTSELIPNEEPELPSSQAETLLGPAFDAPQQQPLPEPVTGDDMFPLEDAGDVPDAEEYFR